MKRYIRNAEEISIEDKLADLINTVKDNFNFAIDGIEKLAADGDISNAIEKARTLNEMIDGAVGEIAEDIATD